MNHCPVFLEKNTFTIQQVTYLAVDDHGNIGEQQSMTLSFMSDPCDGLLGMPEKPLQVQSVRTKLLKNSLYLQK